MKKLWIENQWNSINGNKEHTYTGYQKGLSKDQTLKVVENHLRD